MSMSVNGVYNAYEVQTQKNRTASTGRASRPAEKKKDSVALSDTAKDFKTAQAAVQSTPDVREDVVGPIKKQMQAGNYSVNSQLLADKILKGVGLA